jgi:hypothetical protein
VKVGNEPAARPQSGLNQADIVFEEPIEGAITRLIAVFQCHSTNTVGPIRSTRWTDDQLLPMFGHAAFAYAGGIIPEEELVPQAGLIDLSFSKPISAYRRSSNRVPPDNLYANTAGLWHAAHSRVVPRPVFSYSRQSPPGRPVGGVTLAFSGVYTDSWRWTPRSNDWVWYVGSTLQKDGGTGPPVTTTNVLVLYVHTFTTQWVEDSLGSHGVGSRTTGSGSALLLRNGRAIKAKWHRAKRTQPFRITDATTGHPLPLAPGRTWVELLPVTVTTSGLTLLPR